VQLVRADFRFSISALTFVISFGGSMAVLLLMPEAAAAGPVQSGVYTQDRSMVNERYGDLPSPTGQAPHFRAANPRGEQARLLITNAFYVKAAGQPRSVHIAPTNLPLLFILDP
jgi:hypothetical protein